MREFITTNAAIPNAAKPCKSQDFRTGDSRVFQPVGYIWLDLYHTRVSAFPVPHSVHVASGAHIASYTLSRKGSLPEGKVDVGSN
jgi:hypothetical protein